MERNFKILGKEGEGKNPIYPRKEQQGRRRSDWRKRKEGKSKTLEMLLARKCPNGI